MNWESIFSETKNSFWMLDLETTGVNPLINHITSICFVKFHINSWIIEKKYHVRFPLDNVHLVNEETMDFREKNNIDEFEMRLPLANPKQWLDNIMRSFECLKKPPIIFAKHPEFDIGFLNSYLHFYDVKTGFKHSNVYDVNSFVAGAERNPHELKNSVQKTKWFKLHLQHMFDGEKQPHNAHYDCFLQIAMLRGVMI